MSPGVARDRVVLDDTPLVSSARPPVRVPRTIVETTTTRGHRLVTATPTGYRRDLRGWSQPYWVDAYHPDDMTREGTGPHKRILVLDVVDEAGWYEALLSQQDPDPGRYPVYPVNASITWIE